MYKFNIFNKPNQLLIFLIVLISLIILSFEKHVFHLNSSDINFDLLIFLSKGFLTDPFEINLLTPNRIITSILGNSYVLIMGKPENYSTLIKAHLLLGMIPLYLFLLTKIVSKRNYNLNFFLFFILICLLMGGRGEYFITYPFKSTSLIMLIYCCYLLRFKELKEIKIELATLSFVSVFLYAVTFPAMITMLVLFKLKKIKEWKSLIIIFFPTFLLAIIIFLSQYNGVGSYNTWDPYYGRHNIYYTTSFTFHAFIRLISSYNFLVFLSVSIFFSSIFFENEKLSLYFTKIKSLLIKIILSIYLIFLSTSLLRNFDINLPTTQYLDYFFVPLCYMWVSLIIAFFLKKNLFEKYNFNHKFLKFIFIIFLTLTSIIFLEKSKYTVEEKNYVLNLENQIEIEKSNFKKIDCKKKISNFETVQLRLLTEIDNLRPFDYTFQNPYSNMILPRYKKTMEKYTLDPKAPVRILTEDMYAINSFSDCLR